VAVAEDKGQAFRIQPLREFRTVELAVTEHQDRIVFEQRQDCLEQPLLSLEVAIAALR
jgi:hypothetical protein